MANPRIRPYKLKNGREYFVCFANRLQFRDLQNDSTIITANTQARPREGDGLDSNPLFQDGDMIFNGIIFREIPEMRYGCRSPTRRRRGRHPDRTGVPVWAVGDGLGLGQNAGADLPQGGRLPVLQGVGIKMAYGMKKIAKANPAGQYKEWGVFTIYASAQTDA